jgi:CRP-like cAMP-binding protein
MNDGTASVGATGADRTTSALARVPLFAGLEPDALAAAAAHGVRRKACAGAVLFQENAPATTLYVLLDGRVRVTRAAAEGHVVVLHFAHAGDVLGCAILGGARRYPGSAEVVSDATVLAYDERALARVTERSPAVTRNALRMLSGRMEDLRDRLHEMTTESVERRIAHVLVRFADKARDELRRPELPLSRQDLAELVGATQYTVSRVVARWQKAGWLEAGRGRVTVVDVEALRGV